MTTGITAVTAVLCMAVAGIIVVLYQRRFPWRTNPVGPWIVLAFGLLTTRHVITAIDVWIVPHRVAELLVAVWNLVALTLYVRLLGWMLGWMKDDRASRPPPPDKPEEGE